MNSRLLACVTSAFVMTGALAVVVPSALAAATTGTVSVSNGVFWNEVCVDHDYAYQIAPEAGYTDLSLEARVEGPDGYYAGDGSDRAVPASGAASFSMCGEWMKGNYRLTVTVTACQEYGDFDCYDTALAPQMFSMRLPKTRTTLRANRTNVRPGQIVHFVARVSDERPNGYFRSDYGDIWLEGRRAPGKKWKRIPGSKGFMGDGIYDWRIKYRHGRESYRAVTATNNSHAGSVSRLITIRWPRSG